MWKVNVKITWKASTKFTEIQLVLFWWFAASVIKYDTFNWLTLIESGRWITLEHWTRTDVKAGFAFEYESVEMEFCNGQIYYIKSTHTHTHSLTSNRLHSFSSRAEIVLQGTCATLRTIGSFVSCRKQCCLSVYYECLSNFMNSSFCRMCAFSCGPKCEHNRMEDRMHCQME